MRIVSDGTELGTVIYDDSGNEMRNVESLSVRIVAGGFARAKLHLVDVPIDIVVPEDDAVTKANKAFDELQSQIREHFWLWLRHDVPEGQIVIKNMLSAEEVEKHITCLQEYLEAEDNFYRERLSVVSGA